VKRGEAVATKAKNATTTRRAAAAIFGQTFNAQLSTFNFQ
jgi:hypothetical protein